MFERPNLLASLFVFFLLVIPLARAQSIDPKDNLSVCNAAVRDVTKYIERLEGFGPFLRAGGCEKIPVTVEDSGQFAFRPSEGVAKSDARKGVIEISEKTQTDIAYTCNAKIKVEKEPDHGSIKSLTFNIKSTSSLKGSTVPEKNVTIAYSFLINQDGKCVVQRVDGYSDSKKYVLADRELCQFKPKSIRDARDLQECPNLKLYKHYTIEEWNEMSAGFITPDKIDMASLEQHLVKNKWGGEAAETRAQFLAKICTSGKTAKEIRDVFSTIDPNFSVKAARQPIQVMNEFQKRQSYYCLGLSNGTYLNDGTLPNAKDFHYPQSGETSDKR